MTSRAYTWRNKPTMDLTPYMCDGVKITPIARRCVIRADGLIGRTKGYYAQLTQLTDADWFTPDQIMQRAGIDRATLKRRLADRWTFNQLIKPLGYERVVDFLRNGLDMQDGARLRLDQIVELTGATPAAILARVVAGKTAHDVLAPCKQVPPVPVAELSDQALRDMHNPAFASALENRFIYKGFLDTLGGHCRRNGILEGTVRARIARGVDRVQALSAGRLTRSDKGKPNPRRGKW